MTVIKLQALFEKIKNYNSNPEIALRRAIILQAIMMQQILQLTYMLSDLN